jgi:putative DNA primase/helicase
MNQTYADFQATLPPVPDDPPPPESIINCANGLLDRATRTLYAHTPRWFSMTILPYDYDPAATCPTWLNFLGETSRTETDWLDCLQMWAGYNLVADTKQQKMMLMVGTPGTGKSTVLRTLQHVWGEHNCVSPRLSSFGADQFGLAPLLNKLSAVCDDAHLSRNTDSTMILEILAGIVGEGKFSVRRMYKSHVECKFNVRFTIAVNELLAFPDPAGKLTRRLIVLPFRDSHVGTEDIYLSQRLEREASGILNWCLDGLDLLATRGRLTQPAAGTQILHEFSRLSAPATGFLDDYCVYPAAGQSVTCEQLFRAWCLWCDQNGHNPGNAARFGQHLNAAAPSAPRVQRGGRNGREWHRDNISLSANGLSALMAKSQAEPYTSVH